MILYLYSKKQMILRNFKFHKKELKNLKKTQVRYRIKKTKLNEQSVGENTHLYISLHVFQKIMSLEQLLEGTTDIQISFQILISGHTAWKLFQVSNHTLHVDQCFRLSLNIKPKKKILFIKITRIDEYIPKSKILIKNH